MGQGLLGIDPDLSMQLGLGLLAAGGKNLAGQGNIGTALQTAMGNYYGQKKAQQDLQSTALANQQAAQKNALLQQAMQQYMQPQGSQQPATAPSASPSSAQLYAPTPGPGAASGGAPSVPSAIPPAPTDSEINSMPVNGRDPNAIRALGLALNKDPMVTDKEIYDRQHAAIQEKFAPTLSKLQTIIKSDDPTRAVNADGSLKAAWSMLAPQLGYDPVSDFNPQNVRTALTYGHNQLASAIGSPTLSPTARMIQGTAPDGRITQTDPITGKVTYEAAGPGIITAEDKVKNNMEAARLAMEQRKSNAELGRVGMPNGYEQDPDNPGSIRPIAGGPADPTAVGGGMGNRNEVMFQRVANAGNSAAESIKNIGELPVGASTGWLGGYRPGTSLLTSVKGVLAQKMNSQDVQDYQTMLAGVSRNLATLETSGLAPGGSLTHSMDALTIGEGDTHMTKLRKMAEMRQIVDTNLQPQLSNPKIPQPQKDMVRGILAKVDEAVPFTHSDITRLEQSRNPQSTIMDFARGQGLGGATAPATPTAPASRPSQPDLAAAAAAELKRRAQAAGGN
jgi:hypothetical protein